MNIIKYVAVIAICMFSTFSNAGLIFQFDLEGIDTDFASGDYFTIEFVNDDNFGGGLTVSDISSISFDIDKLGIHTTNNPLFGHVLNVDNLFSFTSLGSGNWLVDLTVGDGFVTDARVIFDGNAGERSQFTQNTYNSLYFSNGSLVATTNVNTTLRSSNVSVPEPSTLAIFALGMIGLASRRFKKQS